MRASPRETLGKLAVLDESTGRRLHLSREANDVARKLIAEPPAGGSAGDTPPR